MRTKTIFSKLRAGDRFYNSKCSPPDNCLIKTEDGVLWEDGMCKCSLCFVYDTIVYVNKEIVEEITCPHCKKTFIPFTASDGEKGEMPVEVKSE
jgi:hypothetical protein